MPPPRRLHSTTSSSSAALEPPAAVAAAKAAKAASAAKNRRSGTHPPRLSSSSSVSSSVSSAAAVAGRFMGTLSDEALSAVKKKKKAERKKARAAAPTAATVTAAAVATPVATAAEKATAQTQVHSMMSSEVAPGDAANVSSPPSASRGSLTPRAVSHELRISSEDSYISESYASDISDDEDDDGGAAFTKDTASSATPPALFSTPAESISPLSVPARSHAPPAVSADDDADVLIPVPTLSTKDLQPRPAVDERALSASRRPTASLSAPKEEHHDHELGNGRRDSDFSDASEGDSSSAVAAESRDELITSGKDLSSRPARPGELVPTPAPAQGDNIGLSELSEVDLSSPVHEEGSEHFNSDTLPNGKLNLSPKESVAIVGSMLSTLQPPTIFVSSADSERVTEMDECDRPGHIALDIETTSIEGATHSVGLDFKELQAIALQASYQTFSNSDQKSQQSSAGGPQTMKFSDSAVSLDHTKTSDVLPEVPRSSFMFQEELQNAFQGTFFSQVGLADKSLVADHRDHQAQGACEDGSDERVEVVIGALEDIQFVSSAVEADVGTAVAAAAEAATEFLEQARAAPAVPSGSAVEDSGRATEGPAPAAVGPEAVSTTSRAASPSVLARLLRLLESLVQPAAHRARSVLASAASVAHARPRLAAGVRVAAAVAALPLLLPLLVVTWPALAAYWAAGRPGSIAELRSAVKAAVASLLSGVRRIAFGRDAAAAVASLEVGTVASTPESSKHQIVLAADPAAEPLLTGAGKTAAMVAPPVGGPAAEPVLAALPV
ncbi:hypothetical protein HK405_002923 [Cladochytrium tenue]|nr:hypothetical protein HK405_002923 [Cladochytrium tenue]